MNKIIDLDFFQKYAICSEADFSKIVNLLEKIYNGNLEDINGDITSILKSVKNIESATSYSKAEDDLISVFESFMKNKNIAEIEKANLILMHFETSSQVSMFALSHILNIVHDLLTHENSNVIFGTTINKDFCENESIISLVVTK